MLQLSETSAAVATDSLPTLLDESQTAKLCGVSRVFLRRRRMQGLAPRWIAITSRCIRYDLSDLRAWLAANTRGGFTTL